uniref:Bowman-Birk serine protease inhibitors family domain-containing protein n=1 Tax=Oryza punctata TaxID=4537 RepID=A0A0E0JKY9_ORYPU
MKSSAIFMLFVALGSLAIVVHGGRTHAVVEPAKSSVGVVQPAMDPITICSPSNFCIPEAWSSCYRCIVKPYDNPPFQTIDECKSNCPVPPASA